MAQLSDYELRLLAGAFGIQAERPDLWDEQAVVETKGGRGFTTYWYNNAFRPSPSGIVLARSVVTTGESEICPDNEEIVRNFFIFKGPVAATVMADTAGHFHPERVFVRTGRGFNFARVQDKLRVFCRDYFAHRALKPGLVVQKLRLVG